MRKHSEPKLTTSQMKSHAAITGQGSAISRYQDVVVGRRSLWFTAYFELCMWLAYIPGAFGLFLRSIFWQWLFGSCGKKVAFAANIIIRHPKRIHIGERVVISEGCILDARNDSTHDVLMLENDVILSNNVMISCKNGTVKIGKYTGIGAQTVIHSTNSCPVSIGADVIIGPQSYIVGGGNYNTDRLDIPMWRQGIKNDGGVTIENDIWLGAKVTVLGGVTMGKGSIAAAGAVVANTVSERAVCGGVPAKEIKKRGGS